MHLSFVTQFLNNWPEKRIGFAHSVGRRQSMEDATSIVGRFADDPTRAFVAVFDGHNGHACAQLGARHLHTLLREQFEASTPKAALREAHHAMSRMMCDAQLDGGTCVVSVFCVDELVFVANCGDWSAILFLFYSFFFVPFFRSIHPLPLVVA